MAIPFTTTDWRSVPVTVHPGESGVATWKTLQYGDLRIRLVEYSAGYSADHWCRRGHILYCLEGTLTTTLSDGSTYTLTAGMSYQVTDGLSAHQSSTDSGARLLIVDGGFLKSQPVDSVFGFL